MLFQLFLQGTLIAVPRVETAERYLAGNPNPFPHTRRAVVGSPATVRAGLEQVTRDYGADELMVVTICHSHAARRRSYELIASAFR